MNPCDSLAASSFLSSKTSSKEEVSRAENLVLAIAKAYRTRESLQRNVAQRRLEIRRRASAPSLFATEQEKRTQATIQVFYESLHLQRSHSLDLSPYSSPTAASQQRSPSPQPPKEKIAVVHSSSSSESSPLQPPPKKQRTRKKTQFITHPAQRSVLPKTSVTLPVAPPPPPISTASHLASRLTCPEQGSLPPTVFIPFPGFPPMLPQYPFPVVMGPPFPFDPRFPLPPLRGNPFPLPMIPTPAFSLPPASIPTYPQTTERSLAISPKHSSTTPTETVCSYSQPPASSILPILSALYSFGSYVEYNGQFLEVLFVQPGGKLQLVDAQNRMLLVEAKDVIPCAPSLGRVGAPDKIRVLLWRGCSYVAAEREKNEPPVIILTSDRTEKPGNTWREPFAVLPQPLRLENFFERTDSIEFSPQNQGETPCSCPAYLPRAFATWF